MFSNSFSISVSLLIISFPAISICRLDIPKVLMISLDGFRWDYLEKASTPNFDRIIRSGVHAKKGIKNIFPTKTFPNHQAIVTGLYAERHGIIGDYFYDSDFTEIFDGYDRRRSMEPKWYKNGGEPIWITNQKNSKERRSGCLFWPSCGPTVDEITPFRHVFFDASMSNRTRIDTVIEWFKDEYPINLALLYFDETDVIGHLFGPDSPQMAATVQRMDDVIGYLLHALEESELLNNMHIIITSDHGMTNISRERLINLSQHIPLSWYQMFTKDPIADILPKTGMEEPIYDILRNISHLKVYKKINIPERYHYKNHRRVQPLLLVPDEGYSIVYNNASVYAGNHGYDNDNPDMHPFFVAMGPMFRGGSHVETFDIVDIYPMLCYILRLVPAPNNGSFENVRRLLKEEDVTGPTFVAYIIVPLFVITVFSGVCIWSWKRHKQYEDNGWCSRVPLLQEKDEDEETEEDEV